MTSQYPKGLDLIAEIDQSPAATPTLWWLGHSGFAIKFADIVFYVDPCLGRTGTRTMPPPLDPAQVSNADLVLCTHPHRGHLDPETIPPLLAASRRARLVIPKSAAGQANAIGVGYERMTTTDSDLRVEYFKGGLYSRIYSIPSAHEDLQWTALGGYPYLGYILRFGDVTIYHSGDSVPYEGMVDRLRPYGVTVALLPISGRPGNFSIPEAAQLAEDIGARWLVPMHYGTFTEPAVDVNRFIEHMLGHRPAQRFKVFECGERWSVP